MTNLEKICFAINQIPINNCNGFANLDAITAVRYLQEVHHALSQQGVSKQLPNFLYEDEGQVKIGYHGDTVVTDEWNKWKEGNMRID